jgi:hypothetical protein
MSKRNQSLYVLTPEDGDRIDHLLGVLATAISELLVAKRIIIPTTPDILPAENQLYDEKNDLSRETIQSESYDF